jgi:hypothetical protein
LHTARLSVGFGIELLRAHVWPAENGEDAIAPWTLRTPRADKPRTCEGDERGAVLSSLEIKSGQRGHTGRERDTKVRHPTSLVSASREHWDPQHQPPQ